MKNDRSTTSRVETTQSNAGLRAALEALQVAA